jgi:hypothetical protein
MEYIQMKPNNIDVYVNEFHTCIKYEFEKSINKMYNEEINVYRDFIETIVKLPFIQVIIEENKTLKAKLQLLEENNNSSNSVKLEIIDKPVSKTVLDIENIPFDTNNDDEDDSSTDDEDDDDEDDSSSDEDDEDDSSSDEDDDDDNNGVAVIPVKVNNGDIEEQPVKKEEEEEEEPSADEEEESADQEDNKLPTFPIIKVNKLEGKNNLEEVNIKKVAEEEIETETEEEQSEDEEEPTADPDQEEPSADPDQEEPSADKYQEPSADPDQEEPSADPDPEEPSADQDEVVEIEIDGVTYYCDDEENGNIYEDDNGEVGNIVGEIKEGEALFFE